MPATPSARSLAAHFRAVTTDTMNISAAAAGGQPSTTIRRASRSRARGVRAALAWTTKTSRFVKRFFEQLSAFGDRVDDSAARSDAGDESVVCELRQARVHRTGKGPILRAGPLTDDADQLVAVPGLLGDRVQESKWCVVVSAMSSASPRSLSCRPGVTSPPVSGVRGLPLIPDDFLR
jgi:hypothetical protein